MASVQAAHRAVPVALPSAEEAFLLRLETDNGLVGWGEASIT
jgi:L-alanine-DL-glutamate epimerase-like enolase superfamily enzyme